MNDGPKKTAQQIIREIAARRKTNEATKPAASIQGEAAKLKGEPELPADLSSKPAQAAATMETVTAGNSALIGCKVRLFERSYQLGDVSEMTPMSYIRINCFDGVPSFWIRHKASGAREACDGVSNRGGYYKFVSDEGLLVTLSGGDRIMEAMIGEPTGSVFPVFASPEPMPIAECAEKAKKILRLIKTPLRRKPKDDRFLDLGNNFFLAQGGCGFNIDGDALTDAGQSYHMYHVNPDRVKRMEGFGRKISEKSHHNLCESTEDVPYQREFELHVGQQRQFALGDSFFTISLTQIGKDMLFTDVRIY